MAIEQEALEVPTDLVYDVRVGLSSGEFQGLIRDLLVNGDDSGTCCSFYFV